MKANDSNVMLYLEITSKTLKTLYNTENFCLKLAFLILILGLNSFTEVSKGHHHRFLGLDNYYGQISNRLKNSMQHNFM